MYSRRYADSWPPTMARAKSPGWSAFAALVAIATAVALVAAVPPASAQTDDAGPWPQNAKDAGATRQADVVGPTDPGVKWLVDLAETSTDDAPEGYRLDHGTIGHGTDNEPTLGPDGKILLRAYNNEPPEGDDDGQVRLIALDPDDGSVAWEVPDVVPQCTQAVDSQGRIWVLRDDGEELALEAIDADGELIDGTRLEGVWRCYRTGLQVGGDTEHLLIYGIGNTSTPGVMAIDVSGDEPDEAWRIDLHTDGDAPFDELVQPHRGVIDGSSLFLAVQTEQTDESVLAEVVRIGLADGSVEDRRTLEVVSDDPDHDGRVYSPVRLMQVDDDRLVVGATRRSGAGNDVFGYLAAIDYAGDMDQAWLSRTTGPDTLARLDTGPKRMALGDGVVITQPGGRNELVGFSVADGTVAWEETPVLGTGAFSFRLITDASGATYTNVPDPNQQLNRGIGRIDADGQLDWVIPDGAIEQDQDLDDDDGLQPELRYSAIGADGTLYIRERIHSRVLALDSSGGLTEAPPEEPPDDDPPDDDPPASDPPPSRVSGQDRFATAAGICAEFVDPNPATVYVATGLDFPDALTGGVPAALQETCMLLTLPDSIPNVTASELQRLSPQSIIVLGGTAAVSEAVVAELGGYTAGPVHRLQGRTRFETAATISSASFQPARTSTAFVATGLNFPDALAGVPVATSAAGPILLSTQSEIPAATAQELSRLGLEEIVVLGGSAVVSDGVLAQLGQYAPRVTRVAGADRFATSVALGQRLLEEGRPDPLTVFVATGGQFPDALAGGAIAGATPGPIYLATPDTAPESILAELRRVGPDHLVVFGGASAISASTEQRLREAAASGQDPGDG